MCSKLVADGQLVNPFQPVSYDFSPAAEHSKVRYRRTRHVRRSGGPAGGRGDKSPTTVRCWPPGGQPVLGLPLDPLHAGAATRLPMFHGRPPGRSTSSTSAGRVVRDGGARALRSAGPQRLGAGRRRVPRRHPRVLHRAVPDRGHRPGRAEERALLGRGGVDPHLDRTRPGPRGQPPAGPTIHPVDLARVDRGQRPRRLRPPGLPHPRSRPPHGDPRSHRPGVQPVAPDPRRRPRRAPGALRTQGWATTGGACRKVAERWPPDGRYWWASASGETAGRLVRR